MFVQTLKHNLKIKPMKKNELRIGNYVYHPLMSDNYQVNENDLLAFAKNLVTYTPITLTEEWLLKLGFKQCGYEMLSWKHETLLPSFDLGGINWADSDEPDYQFLTYKVADEILRIDYVHQLQNLYFALTGEELTFK
jgi:hypothetical protein